MTVRGLRKFLPLFLGAAIVGGYFAFHQKPFHQEEEEAVTRINETTVALTNEALANVVVTKAKKVNLAETLELMGRVSVTEDRTTVVPARVSGRTDSVRVTSGETVTQGQILLTLFSPDFIAAREEYLQSLKQSSGSSDFSELSKMSRKKLETMGLSRADIDGLSSQNTQEPRLQIRAPRAGIIITKNAVIGSLVNVGDTLFTIADVSKVWFTGDLYPEDIMKVQKGQKIEVRAIDGVRMHGTVSFISPVIDAAARTIKIRALIENPNLILKADMYIQGALVLGEQEKLVIPSRALTRLDDSYSVFRRLSENQFQKTSVKIGSEQGDLTAIEAGIKEGDEVISDGGALLLNATLNSARN